MAGDFDMAASKLLAGSKLLSELSEKQKQAGALAGAESRWRAYEAWRAALPISKSDQELVRIVDIMRQRLVAGDDVGKRLKSALLVYDRRRRLKHRNAMIRRGVEIVHEVRGLPMEVLTPSGPGAFEEAGRLFPNPPLSAEQVKKIYYAEKKKLPRKKKTRPSIRGA
jgi:hypothetical protein